MLSPHGCWADLKLVPAPGLSKALTNGQLVLLGRELPGFPECGRQEASGAVDAASISKFRDFQVCLGVSSGRSSSGRPVLGTEHLQVAGLRKNKKAVGPLPQCPVSEPRCCLSGRTEKECEKESMPLLLWPDSYSSAALRAA